MSFRGAHELILGSFEKSSTVAHIEAQAPFFDLGKIEIMKRKRAEGAGDVLRIQIVDCQAQHKMIDGF